MTHIDIYTERFSVSLLIATITHLGIIYGVGFILPQTAAHPISPTMEVILVQKKTDIIPKQADYLAQVAQEGGGEMTSKRERPATPTLAPFPSQTAELVAMPPPPQVATGAFEPQIEQMTTFQPNPFQVEQSLELNTTSEEPSQGDDEETSPLNEESPLDTLISKSYNQVASLQAELRKKIETYAKHPHKKYINGSTREYKYAKYIDTWRKKVQRLGRLNYPQMALSKKLEGSVVLRVEINSDGTIRDFEIIKTSGQKILDDATLRVLHLAAPFPAFPPEIRKEDDVLSITQVWNWELDLRLD